MVKAKKTSANIIIMCLIILSFLFQLTFASCGNKNKSNDNAEIPEETINQTNTTEDKFTDNLPKLDYKGYEFRIASFENANFHWNIIPEEQTAETLNDALYLRNENVAERFNIEIKQIMFDDFSNYPSKCIKSGEDAFDIAVVRCPDALVYWQDDMIVPMNNIPNIDLNKPYWDQSLNKSLSLNNIQYVALGAFDINCYDLTFSLVFNKGMIEDLGLPNPYEIVKSGEWTYDKMAEMMTESVSDLNGDGKMDQNDRFGYLAHPKMVLPNFWISAGEKSVAKDENDAPYLAMNTERFMSVFNKVFEITWDNKVWYARDGADDIPDYCIKMFSSGNSLFCDMSFFHMEKLRSMDADFGIIPYPKYDLTQDKYYARVAYYMATVIPTTNHDLERTGAVIEGLYSESAKTVVPAFYEISLKTKFSRDEESSEMLDLIFSSRIVDIGDTTLCDKIRDGFIAGMFMKNNRNISSKIESTERIISKFIDKIPAA